MLDHETIRSFVKVAECCSFSRAAESLHKTSATISYRIKVLEEGIGTQLFLRTTRSVTLTPAGSYLLERCRQWLNWLDSMPGELKQINQGVEPRVDIVINNLLYNADSVADLLAHLSVQYPFTTFHITRQVYMGVWDTLLNGDCHLAIGVTGRESLENSISVLPLGKVEWVFVVEPQHPLAEGHDTLTEEQLRWYPAVNIEDTAVHLAKRVAWLLPGQQEIKVADMNTKLQCHLRGVGIGFLPRTLCQPYLDSGELVERTLINHRQSSPLSLAWSHERGGEVVKALVAMFESHDPMIQGFYSSLQPLNL